MLKRTDDGKIALLEQVASTTPERHTRLAALILLDVLTRMAARPPLTEKVEIPAPDTKKVADEMRALIERYELA